MLASLIGYFGDWDLAEDAAAEAFAIAAQRWPSDGVPDHPAAWLVTTARRRAIDRLRRDRVLAAKLRLLAATQPPAAENTGEDTVDTSAIPDERLELVFMCCHPALAVEAQVALTLRAVGGLSTEEIARAFLVPPETMKRRLTRAKSKIKVAGIPFGVPSGPRLPERLGAILAVVYLIFNEGYGDPDRPGLAAEAIRLGRVLAVLLPAQPEVLGLLALMLLHDSRRETRFTGNKRRPGPGPAARSGPVAVGLAADRRGPGPARPSPHPRRGPDRAVRHSGGDRLPAGRGAARLAADLGPLRQARRADRLPGGPA